MAKRAPLIPDDVDRRTFAVALVVLAVVPLVGLTVLSKHDQERFWMMLGWTFWAYFGSVGAGIAAMLIGRPDHGRALILAPAAAGLVGFGMCLLAVAL